MKHWKLLVWLAVSAGAFGAWIESATAQQRAPEGRLIGTYNGGSVWRVQDRSASCYVVVNSDGKAAGISCVGGP